MKDHIKRYKRHYYALLGITLVMALGVFVLMGQKSWAQTAPRLVVLLADETGGQCTALGTWDGDATGGTCTMDRDRYGSVSIQGDNVTLDCNNYSITGDGIGNGVFLDNVNGSAVRNCHVSGFDVGVGALGASGGMVADNTVSENANMGIFMYDSTVPSSGNTLSYNTNAGISYQFSRAMIAPVTISGNSVNNSGSGIQIKDAIEIMVMDNQTVHNTIGVEAVRLELAQITDNEIAANGTGLRLESTVNITISGNDVSDNNTGIGLVSSSENTVYNNVFDNSLNVSADAASPNAWNTEKTAGTNIIDGPYLGGNYWNDYIGEDADRDRLGDSPYVIDANSQDNWPLMHEAWAQPPTYDADGQAVLMELDHEKVTWIIYSLETGSNFDFDGYVVRLPEGLSSALVTINSVTGILSVKAHELDEAGGRTITISAPENFAIVEEDTEGDSIILKQVGEVIQIEAPDCAPQPSDMLHWWDFDHLSGDYVLDQKGNVDGQLQNGTSIVPGAVNDGAQFDGTDDQMTAYVSSDPSELTVDAWVYLDPNAFDSGINPPELSGNVMMIFSKEGAINQWELSVVNDVGANSKFMTLKWDNGSLERTFQFGYSSQYPRPPDGPVYNLVDSGKWRHVTLLLTPDAMTAGTPYDPPHLVINGTNVPYVAYSDEDSEWSGTLNPKFILGSGRSVYDPIPMRRFMGVIDEVELFDRELDYHLEALPIYQAGYTGKCRPFLFTEAVYVHLNDGNYQRVSSAELNTGDSMSISLDATSDASRVEVLSGEVEMEGLIVQEFPIYRASLDTGDVTNISLDATQERSTLSVLSGSLDVSLLDGDGRKTLEVEAMPTGDALEATIDLSSFENVFHKVHDSDLNLRFVDDDNQTVARALLPIGVEVATRSVADGLTIRTTANPLDLTRQVADASATFRLGANSQVLFKQQSPGADMMAIPLTPVEFECTSASTTIGDKCFALKKEHVTDEVAVLAPVGAQLIRDGVQTVVSSGLSETAAFSSATIDGVPVTEPFNALVFAPLTTYTDGDGTDNIECGAQMLEQGIVNALVRYIIDGVQSCEPPVQGDVTEENNVVLHVIDQAKTGVCGGAGSCKFPVEGAEVRVFDRNDAAFQAAYGTQNPSGTVYDEVFENDIARVSTCTTDSTGSCIAYEEAVGDYLVIVKYVDAGTGSTVYTGLPKDPSDFVNNHAVKDFQFIKVIKKNGSVEFKGGRKTVVVGSQLDIVYPVAAIWDEGVTDYVYPFIFTSNEDWEVDVCSQVPEGYEISGIYDENGDLITSDNCYQTFVNGETKVVAFQVVMVGSPPEWAMNTKIKVKHNDKKTDLDLDIKTKVKDKDKDK